MAVACCFSLAVPWSKVCTGPRATRLPAGICGPTGACRMSLILSLRWPGFANLPMTFAPSLMRTAATWGDIKMLPGPLQPWRCFRPGSKAADAATQALLGWAEDSLGAGEYAMVPAAELLARWSAASAGNGTGKSNASLLARVLERHGMGMEPDVRFGGLGPVGQAPVVLFRRAAEIIRAPSDRYAAAATLIQLGAAAVSADGRVTAAERDMLERRVMLAPGLAEDERRRLRAHFMRVLAEPPTPAALRKRMSLLHDAQRREAGDLLVALAMSDGGIDQAEIDRLTRLFDALGLDRPDLYGQLRTSGEKDLARLRTAGAPAPGYAIPRSPSEEARSAAAVVLDPELIRARLAESERAASYLAQIFTGDDTGSQAAVSTGLDTPEDKSSNTSGLDVSHRIFLTRLADRPSWTRDELDAIAAQLGLLPDGALEILNEAAFEAAGEPVCEGTDPVEINSYALKEMLG